MVSKKIVEGLLRFRQAVRDETPITKMYLFGSRAWGKPHPDSDIDLLVVSPSFRHQRSLKRGIHFYRYWDLDYPVDFLCYTPEEFKRLKKSISLVKQVVEKGIEIKKS